MAAWEGIPARRILLIRPSRGTGRRAQPGRGLAGTLAWPGNGADGPARAEGPAGTLAWLGDGAERPSWAGDGALAQEKKPRRPILAGGRGTLAQPDRNVPAQPGKAVIPA
jgi:hypothetical protein